MKYVLIILTTFFVVLFSLNCNTTEPDNNSNGIDTTSHNFSFSTWKFGDGGSSILYDVAIVNENDIWAVGEIYLNDSLGQPDPHPYGIMHWDGLEWKVKRLTSTNPSGGTSYIIPTGIFVLSPSEIWLARGGVHLFNGEKITKSFYLINYPGYDGGIFNNGKSANKLFGTDPNNLYTVGNKGAIAFYNGKSWNLIESGTDLDITDIRGSYIQSNLEIYAVASKQFVNTNKKILKIENNIAKELSASGIPSSIKSIWFKPGTKYYVVGSGMFSRKDINSAQSWEPFWQEITQYYINSIDGNDLNDIAACGAYGELLHYNGADWKSFQNELHLNAGSYQSIKIKNNIIAAAGYDSPKAVITIGKRQIN